MKLIKNGGQVPGFKGKYIFEANCKNINRKIYAKPGICTAFWGVLYEFGIAKWKGPIN